MRLAFLLIIAVQCVWSLWSGYINPLHASELIGNARYFWSIFVAAALIDYYCIQVLTAMPWSTRSYKYFKYLISLLAASIFLHTVGMVGFLGGSTLLLKLYDTTSVFLLIAELGIFVLYGMDLVRDRSIARSGVGN